MSDEEESLFGEGEELIPEKKGPIELDIDLEDPEVQRIWFESFKVGQKHYGVIKRKETL